MAITEERPNKGECPRATSLQRINKRLAYSHRHAQLCVCRRPCRHYAAHRPCTDRGNTDLSSSRTVGVLNHKPAPRESDKTQVTLFHLRNRECDKQLNISWNGVNLNPLQPPGVSWRHTRPNVVIYSTHREDQKESRNKKQHHPKTKKLKTKKLKTTPTTLSSSALALGYSAVEYACPVWERSTHAKKLDATLNETCRMITGCLKPTNTNSLPVLAGIAPSDIRRAVASHTERTRQTTDERHPLNGHLGVVPRLKSRKSFIKCTEPINTTAKDVRMELGRERLEFLDDIVHINISADEHLPAGAEYPWTTWKALSRLRTQVGRSRVNMSKWGYSNETETCDCGIRQTMQHLLVCPMINTACSTHNGIASPSAVPGIGRAPFD